MSDERIVIVLESLDDVWQTFDEVAGSARLYGRLYATNREIRNTLASLRVRGLVESHRSDSHGRVEYAITEAGEAFLASWPEDGER